MSKLLLSVCLYVLPSPPISTTTPISKRGTRRSRASKEVAAQLRSFLRRLLLLIVDWIGKQNFLKKSSKKPNGERTRRTQPIFCIQKTSLTKNSASQFQMFYFILFYFFCETRDFAQK
jgi:hypothetical protein